MKGKHWKKLSLMVSLLFIVALALTGCGGSDGAAGAKGDTGAPGTPGSTTGTVSGTVNGPNAAGLAGVKVSNNITADTATTDSTGKFSLSLPIGTYTLTFTLTGYTTATAAANVAAAGSSSVVTATMSQSASGLPSVVIATDKNEVGFGNTVNLKATVTPGSNGGTVASYAWSITPPAAGSAQGLAKIAAGATDKSTAVVTMPVMNDPVTCRGAFDGTVTTVGGQVFHTLPDGYFPAQSAAPFNKDCTGAAAAASAFVPGDVNFVAAFVPETGAGRLQVLPILPDTRASVTVALKVTDSLGGTVTVGMPATQPLNAASIQTGVRAVAVGGPVYLNSAHATPWAYTLTAPSGSTAKLSSATAQYPFFVPDVVGKYTVTEGGVTIAIYAGNYVGVIANSSAAASYTTRTFDLGIDADAEMSGMWYDTTVTAYWPAGATRTTYAKWPVVVPDSNCMTCHANNVVVNGLTAPDNFTPWAKTAHATFFARGIDGITGNSGTCLTCHTVGYDLSVLANSGGFDDVAAANGFVYPANRVSGNWGNMFANAASAKVGRLANIQCENCHGPQDTGLNGAHISGVKGGTSGAAAGTRVSFSSEVCGSCHASGTGHHIYSEWQMDKFDNDSGHSKLSVAIAHPNCGCHSAQAFVQYIGTLAAGNPDYDFTAGIVDGKNPYWTPADVQAQTCTACHDPHDATNPNQLRVYNNTPVLTAGFQAKGVGKGALCMVCHSGRSGTKCNGTVVTTEPLNGIPTLGPIPMGATAGTLATVNACIVAAAGDKPRSSTSSFLHEDNDPYMMANPTYGGIHDAGQAEVLMGRNAFFMGNSLPMISRHASVKDSCVGCHMALNPTTHNSHGAPATSSHTWTITDDQMPTLCANCHSGNVGPDAVQANTNVLLDKVMRAQEAYIKARINAAITAANAPYWRSLAVANSTSKPQGTAANPYLYTAFTTVSKVTTTNGTSFAIFDASNKQQGVATTGATTPATYSGTTVFAKGATGYSFFFTSADATVGNKLYKSQQNVTLVTSRDGSLGVHNPSFVTAVLNNTAAAMSDTTK